MQLAGSNEAVRRFWKICVGRMLAARSFCLTTSEGVYHGLGERDLCLGAWLILMGAVQAFDIKFQNHRGSMGFLAIVAGVVYLIFRYAQHRLDGVPCFHIRLAEV